MLEPIPGAAIGLIAVPLLAYLLYPPDRRGRATQPARCGLAKTPRKPQ